MREERMILNLTRGNVLCEHVEIADKALLRMRGVLGRSSLPRGRACCCSRRRRSTRPSCASSSMPCSWMAAFTSRGSSSGSSRGASSAPSMRSACSSSPPVRWRVAGFEVGDQIVVADGEFALGARALQPADVWPAGQTRRRARSLEVAPRVLLVGSDRRFRSVAAALLQRRGYSVAVGEQVSTMAEDAVRERADVVVLDAGTVPIRRRARGGTARGDEPVRRAWCSSATPSGASFRRRRSLRSGDPSRVSMTRSRSSARSGFGRGARADARGEAAAQVVRVSRSGSVIDRAWSR